MIVNLGWCVAVGTGDARRYLVRVAAGEPLLTAEIKEAKFSDEYEARKLALAVDRVLPGARAMYVPFSERGNSVDPWMLVG